MDRLQADQMLGINQQLISNNGWLNLILQGDGNVVLYRTQVGQPLWASNTSGQPVHRLLMQADGNLVAYSLLDVALWSTGMAGHPGSALVLQDDGNLVVYDSTNNPIWAFEHSTRF